MDYKIYIQRKIGSLVNKRNNEFLKSTYAYRFRGMTDNKEKEVIVYLRNQVGLDKQQLMEFSKDKFNLNDVDAERLFDMAFPDGLDLDENKTLDSLEEYLKESNFVSRKAIDSIFNSVLNKTDVEIKSMSPMAINATRLVISSLLQRRKLI